MARLHEVPGCRVLSIEDGHEASVVMHVRGCRCAGRCPVCGTLRDCQEFRVGAAIVDPKEVPDGTTQSTPHP